MRWDVRWNEVCNDLKRQEEEGIEGPLLKGGTWRGVRQQG